MKINEYNWKYYYDSLILPDTGSFLAVTEVLKYLNKMFVLLKPTNVVVSVSVWPGHHVLSVDPAVGDASPGELLDEDAAKPGSNLSPDNSRREGPDNGWYKKYFKIIGILAILASYLVIAIFFCGHMIVSGDWVVVVAIIITRKINISSSTILHQIFAQSDRPCVSFDTEVSDRLYTGLSPRCVMMADFVSLSLR